MIPAGFDYHAPTTLDEAVQLLSDAGEDAKVLAGGQSLIPVLRLRLAAPETVIDLDRVDELRGIRLDGDTLVIGAMTPHHEVATDELVRQHARVLAEAAATVADPQVRHRGTIGGSLAHGDAAGDLPAVALALDAQLVAQGPTGTRTIPASAFFVDYLETVLAPDEVLTEVRIPKLVGDGWGHHYAKFNRVAQAWAIVGSCAIVRRENGSIAEARVGLTNMGATPVRAAATEAALSGATVDGIAGAAEHADEGTAPPTDLNARPDYRRHLARVLTRRALERAARA